eukprot:CAMPEP_0202342746 /NCGR_PEP_ID=MMETSP1126-20121109/3179_1 /ASSEMBLY_ACC=CAM_ASM_000457 /TAXON_ID=3047 /ORGANISM="Dunaliella tertiolecta, Strain CCMP1320" /LENGTH=317 /DNA_ID=CAMNT_0048933747 /DNA_START=196 /DNA_END=1149 /DNA_ORIENTATION=-
MIRVTWCPRWEAAEMLNKHTDLWTHVEAFKKERQEQPADPQANNVNVDNLANQGFDGNLQNYLQTSWLSTNGRAICKNAKFDFLPTNPQTDILPTWQCEIIVRPVDLMKEFQKSDPSREASIPVEMPSFSTYEAACIYNTFGKCVGMLTTERLSTLTEAYEAAKQAGLHNTLQPPVQVMATEIMGLLQRLKSKEKHLLANSKKAYNSNSMPITPSHIRLALKKCCMVSTERYSNPLDFDPSYKIYFSANPRDQVFGACTDALSVRYFGYCFCHPPHDDEIMLQFLRHALHSSIQTDSPVHTIAPLEGLQRQRLHELD